VDHVELDNPAGVARAHARNASFLRLHCDFEEVQRTLSQMRLTTAAFRYASETGRETIRLSQTLIRTIDGSSYGDRR